MDKKDLKDEKLLYNVRETAAVLGVNVHLVLNNPVSMSPLSGDRKPQIRF